VINFSNNTCINAGGAEVDSACISANHVIFQGNNIINSGNVGLKGSCVKKSITCKGNNINGTRTSPGILLKGRSSSHLEWNGLCEYIDASDNTVNNGVFTINYSLSSGSLSDYSLFYFDSAVFKNNVMGTDTKTFIVNSNPGFLLNEKITGNDSGAVATINAFQGITQFGIGVTNYSGSFTTNEIITGNISGITTILQGITSTHKYGSFIFSGNNLWSGNNAWWSGFTLTVSSVTNKNNL